nr:uncharacterized protein LOC115255519 [Aedes albopictus]
MSIEEFVESEMWQHGPPWLALSQQYWPISSPPAVAEDMLETKTVVASVQTTSSINPWFLRWSSYNRLLHTVAYCLRFAEKTRSKARTQPLASSPEIEPSQQSLSVKELTNANNLQALPDPDFQHTPMSALDHLQKLQQHVQKFWSHWRTEYLQEMMKDTKLAARNDEIQPGRMVIIVDEALPTIRWPLARITELHPGKDNLSRVVSLRTEKGVITRPITRICLLPLPPPRSIPDEEQLDSPAASNPPTILEE